MVDPQRQQEQEDVRPSDRKVGDILTQDSCRVCLPGVECVGGGGRAQGSLAPDALGLVKQSITPPHPSAPWEVLNS